MCFFGNLENLRVAQEPFYCFKYMRLERINGEYRLNSQIFPSEDGYAIGDEIVARNDTDEEFADFVNRCKMTRKADDAPIIFQGEMVHSYMCSFIPDSWIDCELDGNTPEFPVVVCEIPNGTVYITNKSEIASRKVVIKGLLCWPE